MFLHILNRLPWSSCACDQLPQQLRIIDLYTETAHEGDDVVVHHASDTEADTEEELLETGFCWPCRFMSSCGNATCAEPLDNANLALFIQWFWEKLGIKDATSMSILAQLPDVSGYVSHKLLSLETLSWLDGYVFRHVRKPSPGLVMAYYLFICLFIYLFIYIYCTWECPTKFVVELHRKQISVPPRYRHVPSLNPHVCRLICVYIYICVCVCVIMIYYVYIRHIKYMYIYIYTNIHLTNLMIYI